MNKEMNFQAPRKKKAILFYLLKIHHSIKKEKGKHSHFAEDMED